MRICAVSPFSTLLDERAESKGLLGATETARKMPSGWRTAPPQVSPGNAYSARAFFCRVQEGELDPVLEKDAYMPGSRGKAAEHQQEIARSAVAESAGVPPVQLDVEGHLAAILKLLQGAPFVATIDGARIQIIPPIREGYRDPDPDLVLSRVFHEDHLLPRLKEAARRERPIVYYELITDLVGYELDPKSTFYLTTVLQAFSRALSTAAAILRRERIMLDRKETRKAPLANGCESKQVLFRRM